MASGGNMDSTSFQKSLDAYAKKKRGKKLTEKEIKDLRKPEPSKVTKEMIEAIMSEKPPKNIIRKLSSEDLEEMLIEKYGKKDANTTISFTLKDISESDERYSRYAVSGVVIRNEITLEPKGS